MFFSAVLDKIIFLGIFLGIARFYSKQDFGIVAAVFALANILESFFAFGFPLYLQRESAMMNSDLNRKFITALWFKSGTLLLFLLIIAGYNFISGSGNYFLTFLIAVSIYLFGISSIFNSVLYGRGRTDIVFVIHLISRLLLIIPFLICIYFNSVIELAFISFIAGALIQILLLCRHFNKHIFKISMKWISVKLLPAILSRSIYLGSGLIFVLMYDKLEILFIQNILTLELVALYASAYSIYKLPQLISNVVLTVSFSIMSYDYNTYKVIYISKISKIFFIILGVILLCLILFNGFSESIVRLSFGKEYLNAAELLRYLSWGLFGLLLNNLTGTILNATGNEKSATISAGIGLLINIPLSIILLMNFGLIGAVIATLSTETIVLVLQSYFIHNKKVISWQ